MQPGRRTKCRGPTKSYHLSLRRTSSSTPVGRLATEPTSWSPKCGQIEANIGSLRYLWQIVTQPPHSDELCDWSPAGFHLAMAPPLRSALITCRISLGWRCNMSSIGCARIAYVDVKADRFLLNAPLVSAAGVRNGIRL